jgi:hypothetical protein
MRRLVRFGGSGRLFVMVDRHRVYAPVGTRVTEGEHVTMFYIGQAYEVMTARLDGGRPDETWKAA